jgi:hypothetical protein
MTSKNQSSSALLLAALAYTVVAVGGFMGPYSGIGALFLVNSIVIATCLVLTGKARMSPLTATLIALLLQVAICIAAVFGTRVDFDAWYQARGAGEVVAILGGPLIVFAAVAGFYWFRPQLTPVTASVVGAATGRFLAGAFAAAFFLFSNWERIDGPAGRVYFWLALGVGLVVGFLVFPMISRSSSKTD